MGNVYWLIRSKRRLRASMSEEIARTGNRAVFDQTLRTYGQLLRETFPHWEAVIVRDRLQGYRLRSHCDIFLVEGIANEVGEDGGDDREPSSYIVKIGDPVELKRELDGWQCCRPDGFVNDSIFVSLRPGLWSDTPEARPKTLVYVDAFQTLGASEVVTLEQGFLDACRFGIPTPESVMRVIGQIFERLGSLFYVQSSSTGMVGNPNEPQQKTNLASDIERWLGEWRDSFSTEAAQNELLRCRRETFGFLSRRRDLFLDPCDYLRSVVECPERAPRMVRGCAHGDLHGRNILINLVQDEAASPAVFDYEDMGPDNLLGLDFVKLETELKVRALNNTFKGSESEYVENVQRFEMELSKRTEDANNNDELWNATGDVLTDLVLGIRRLAKRHMGLDRNREREWLEEYYFLLACYGIRAARYRTYQRRHVIAAYIAAGTATRRLALIRQCLESGIAEMASKAEKALAGPPPDGAIPFKRGPGEISHHARFAFARTWSRSEKHPFMLAAVALLRELRQDYPHVIEINEELVLTCLELNDTESSETELECVSQRYRNLHEETLCRWGRLWKSRAIEMLRSDGGTPSTECLRYVRLALDHYQKAYHIRRNYYPGINVATLRRILGDAEDARVLAQDIIDEINKQTLGVGTDVVWMNATRAEAEVLCDRHEEAEIYYTRAAKSRECLPHHITSMRRQLEMLLAFSANARQYWDAPKLEGLFSAGALAGASARHIGETM